jgi:probable addiction module antidote protein
MRERKPAHEVTYRRLYRADGLDSEERIAYYMAAAFLDDDDAGVLDALDIIGRARLINHLAASTGIDRRRLCAALDGGPLLDAADFQKIQNCFPVPVSEEAPAAVG